MAREKLQGDFAAVPQGLKDQDSRGNQSPDSEPSATSDSAAYVSRVEGSLLEGETPVAKAISLVSPLNIH